MQCTWSSTDADSLPAPSASFLQRIQTEASSLVSLDTLDLIRLSRTVRLYNLLSRLVSACSELCTEANLLQFCHTRRLKWSSRLDLRGTGVRRRSLEDAIWWFFQQGASSRHKVSDISWLPLCSVLGTIGTLHNTMPAGLEDPKQSGFIKERGKYPLRASPY